MGGGGDLGCSFFNFLVARANCVRPPCDLPPTSFFSIFFRSCLRALPSSGDATISSSGRSRKQSLPSTRLHGFLRSRQACSKPIVFDQAVRSPSLFSYRFPPKTGTNMLYFPPPIVELVSWACGRVKAEMMCVCLLLISVPGRESYHQSLTDRRVCSWGRCEE